jgi:DNA-binding PadR family transcriptional regulator
VIDRRGFGRFSEPARLVLAALRDGPRPVPALLDEVRRADGPIGPGSFYAAIARLERRRMIEPVRIGEGGAAYRLIGRGVPDGAVPGGACP